MKTLLCPGGEDVAYDDKQFQCTNCDRALSLLHNHAEMVELQSDRVKANLIRRLKDLKTPAFSKKLSKEEEIASEEKLRQVLNEASEFAQFWISKGRKVKLDISGEVD